jgi:hypothetical protein
LSRPFDKLTLALGLIVCLVASREPQIVGDGGEYLVYSLNFVSLNGPSLPTANLDALKNEARDYSPDLEDETFFRNARRGRGGGWDFMHFWFMSLAAAPFVALAKAVGLPPIYGFVGLNTTMLLGALWVALPRIGLPVSVLLFASPLIWWLDKAHPEVFTFSLLLVAILWVTKKPWWSMIAVAAASTQYPHLGLVVVMIAGAVVVFDRAMLRDRRLIAGFAAAMALSALHPAYYYVRHGTPSLLFGVSNQGVPTWAELSAVMLDPVIGLLPNFPIFPLVILAALVLAVRRSWRDWIVPDVLVAAAAAAFFLWVFGVKDNVHHGATPSLSRYALWFIPLAAPILLTARIDSLAWRRFAWGAAIVSASVCAFAFHPSIPQNGREPTWPAEFLWTKHPGWNNPLPEVFTETHRNFDTPFAPTATAGCEKILTGGPGGVGTWPIPCFPAEISAPCDSRGVWCYANRQGAGYAFVRAPGRWNAPPVVDDALVWPRESEETVRRFYRDWAWWNLRRRDVRAFPSLESARYVRADVLEGADRFVLVLREPRPDAQLTFKLSTPMSGVLVDARTGQTIQTLQSAGPSGQAWDVPIPAEPNLMLLGLKR